MKIRLLWALLSWLSLLSFGARAQTTNVTIARETFEGLTTDQGYTSNTFGAGNVNIYFERRMFTTPGGATTTYSGAGGSSSPSYVSNQQGSYAWMAERVRGNANTGVNANIRVPGYVQLNPITTTNYKNLRVVVAMADPRCASGCSGNTVYYTDRVRVRYSFDGGPFVTAGLLVNSGGTSSLGFWGIDTSAPLDSVSDSDLGTAYRDVTGTISGTGSSLRIQVVVDANLPEITFDNIRVIGDADAGAKPALANIESTTLSYTEGQASPVQVTNSLTVGYSDNSATNITGGTVTISSGFTSGDQLNYSTQGGISGTYNNGVLTLTGTTTQANYQAALRSVTFSNSNTSTLPNGTRQIAFQLSNGTAQSNTPLRNLNVTAVLNTGTLPYTENFDTDGEGTRYFGNSFVRPAVTTGFFRATTSPAYSGSDKIGDLTYTGWSGGYWYGEGTKVGTTGTAIQLAPVNAAGAVGLKFVVAVGSSASQTPGSSTSNYNWDAADYFRLYYRVGGSSGTWMEFGSFLPDANGQLRRGGNTDSVVVGQTLRYFTFPLPSQAAVNGVDFQLLQASDGDEELAFDNIRISAAVLPTVATLTPATNITATSATLGGNVTSNGDGTLTERGVVYVVGTGTPTTSNTKALVSTSGVTTGPFSGTVSGLSPGTTYTVRAYAINEAGTGYGGPITFTTAAVAPTVTTGTAGSIMTTTATISNNSLTSDGGASLTDYGVVYVAGTGTPTTSNSKAQVGTSSPSSFPASFNANLSGLSPGTQYTVRAYATNSVSTSYGGVQTFTTSPALTATVSTTSGSPTSTSPIPFSVSFSQSVGTTFIASDVTVTGGTLNTASFSGSGSGPYTFTVTPTSSGSTVTVSLAANVANDANNTGNLASNSLSVSYQQAVTAAPSLTQPANNSTTNSLPTFSGTAPIGSTVTIYLAMGSNAATAIGTTTATGGNFSFTPATALASGSYAAYATAQASGAAVSGNSNTNSFTVDATAPTVLSSNRQTPTATTTNATTLVFRVTFSEPVTGVDAADFTLTTTGTVSSTGRTVTAVSASVYDVTVSGVSGNGTARVDLNASGTGIADAVGNPISGGYTSGQTYTIDQTAPTVTLSTTATSPTATSPIPFSATFSEPVAGLSASGISVSNGTVTSGSLSGSGSGPYTFTVTPTGSSTVSVSILANAAQDAAGNGNLASNAVSITYSTSTTWTAGAGSQDWFTAGNWSAGVPTASTDALIPAGVRFYPLVTAAGAVTRALTINSPGSVTLAIVGTLTVNGLLTNGGTITQSAGTLTVNGNVSMSGTITKSAGNISVSGSLSNTGTLTQSGGDFTVGSSLTNNSSGTVSQTGGTLSVNGDLTNNNTFTTTTAAGTSGGTVLLGGGTSASNILGSSAIRFWNLTVNASGTQLATSAGASVRSVLTLNGNFVPNGNVFTLESASTGTALVVNNGSSVVTGTTTVQRYIDPSLNSGPGYRHYSAPVSNSTVADLATPTGFTPVVNPTYNTSPTPTSEVPFPTVLGYDNSRLSLTNNLNSFDKGFFSPAALSDPLAVGRGYTVNIGANQLVDFVGSLNNDVRVLNLPSTRGTYPDGGWQFLGNPYPAPLDYSRVLAGDRSGLDAAIYVFSSTSQYGGQYRSYVNTFGNPVLPVGQGFFVRVATNQAGGTMTFRNSQRLTAPEATTFQRTAESRPVVQLTLQGAGSPLPDVLYVYFEQGASDAFDQAFDAEKLSNPNGLNLASSLSASQHLSIDGRAPLGSAQLVVPLAVGVPAAGTYSLSAAQLLNLSQVPVYLRDKQTGALIDLAQQPSYQFAVSNAAVLLTGRFELVFSPQQALATVPAALAQQVLVYPNPAKGQVTIELPASLGSQPVTATLVDAVGRPVRAQVLPAGRGSHTLPLTELATGVYALRLTTELGTIVRKLVVE